MSTAINILSPSPPIPFNVFKFMMCFVGILAVIGAFWMINIFRIAIDRLTDDSYLYIRTYYCGSSNQRYKNVTRIVNILKKNINQTLKSLKENETLDEFCNFEQIELALDYEIQYINYAINKSINDTVLPYTGFRISDEIHRISKIICYMINHQLAVKKCNLRYVFEYNDDLNSVGNFHVVTLDNNNCFYFRGQVDDTEYFLNNHSNGRALILNEYNDILYHKLYEKYYYPQVIDTNIVTGKQKKYIVTAYYEHQLNTEAHNDEKMMELIERGNNSPYNYN
jgi:hypothetical protein